MKARYFRMEENFGGIYSDERANGYIGTGDISILVKNIMDL